MDANNNKNIVILKNLPSNVLEEAIIVVKNKKTAVNIDYLKKGNDSIIQGNMKEADFKKLEKIPKESRNYIVKEAECVMKNYIEKIEDGQRIIDKNKMKRKCKRLKIANFLLFTISVISTISCIIR